VPTSSTFYFILCTANLMSPSFKKNETMEGGLHKVEDFILKYRLYR
jgi:hypothetical protein